jgi:hypothetical protein
MGCTQAELDKFPLEEQFNDRTVSVTKAFSLIQEQCHNQNYTSLENAKMYAQ